MGWVPRPRSIRSDLPSIISPVEKGLALSASAREIAGFAVHLDLPQGSADGFPSLDLSPILPRPIFRKFAPRIRHVFAAEYPELKHLLWSEFGLGLRVEIGSHAFRPAVTVTRLHPVIDEDDAAHHETCASSRTRADPAAAR